MREEPSSSHKRNPSEQKRLADTRKDPDYEEKRKRRRSPSREKSPEFPWLRLTDDGSEFSEGAWAARKEIADLIEMGVSRGKISRLIKGRKESGSPLRGAYPTEARNRAASSGRGRRRDRTASRQREEKPDRTRSKTRSIAGEYTEKTSIIPSSTVKAKTLKSDLGFSKPARPPSPVQERGRDLEPEREGTPSGGEESCGNTSDSKAEADEGEVHPLCRFPEVAALAEGFKKKASPPAPEQKLEIQPPREPRILKKMPMRKDPRTADQYDAYDKATRELFEELLLWEVSMDIVYLVYFDEQLDEARFARLTDPRSPTTGLRYARLLKRFLDWVSTQGRYNEIKPMTAEYLGKFVEYLVEQSSGFNTPKSFLFALEYYSVLFGFVTPKIELRRWKKIAEDYQSRAPERKPAAYLDVKLLGYLEHLVKDTGRSMAERITAGKLRLCVQASIRHSDLTSTPMGLIEWCRYKGSCHTLGLRAKAPVTKSGPRLWAASHLGVSKDGDGWLAALMDLLLISHGEQWRDHEFCGCATTRDGFAPYPSTIDADTAIIRKVMLTDFDEGSGLPITREEAANFRWHGAKATLPTFMGHFGIRTKAIRYQGSWKKKTEAMPDLYLREAQVLVIQSQIQTLDYLRKGVELRLLEGRPLGELAQEIPFCQPDSCGNPIWKMPVPGGEPRDAPEDVVEAMKRCGACSPWSDGSVLPPPDLCPDALELREELCDPSLKIKDKITEELQREKETVLKDDIEEILESEDPPDSGPESSGEDSCESEVVDLEMYTHFVTLRSGSGKVHRPSPDSDEGPMCGVPSRNYSNLNVGDAWEANFELCSTCFGRAAGCKKLCQYEIEKGGVKYRCGRRCATCSDDAERASGSDAPVSHHFCSLHG